MTQSRSTTPPSANPRPGDPVLFRESQRLTQWWILLIVALVTGVSWWGFVEQIVLGRPFGDNPGPDWLLWVVAVFGGVLVPLLVLGLRLGTDVTDQGLAIRYRPFLTRLVRPQDLRSFEAVEYRPLRDWGGWGLRWSPRRGRAYTTSGHRGVQLTFVEGKPLLLGSQRPEELVRALQRVTHGSGGGGG